MIVISGASGRLGRLTVRHLSERVDPSRIVALTRTPEKIADLAGLGVRVRQASFDDTESLARAIDGAERMLVISTGTLGRRVEQHAGAIDVAVKAGVGHVLYTSMTRAGEPGNPLAILADHRDTERILADSGVPFTVLRNSVYADMLSLSLPLDRAVETGVLAGSSGAGHVPYVTRSDCAAVAAAVLADGGHEGQFLDVTGPQALDHHGIAAALSQATGRPVRYEPQAEDEARQELVARLPPEVLAKGAEAALESAFRFWGHVQDGWLDVTTHTVERLTGRPGTTLAEFFATSGMFDATAARTREGS
ncbi:SDR family oxidoreductase [Streptosporangium carneum]|uniref:NAD(P)-dependent oxidoreductase n=1 Tax=Streptosporangium carneum TaxID=47481 RepID=A0A9W6MBB6_9ACTN|nr:SDR family oxidoreductase [Streptosporangium carneum]GLK07498.1 NAD(P)-dependent oxidoreductase [Streptosporangium carneum]